MDLHYNVSVAEQMPHRVALCAIATGRYRVLLPRFLASARRYFLPEEHVSLVVFSDGARLRHACHYWVHVDEVPWPYPTLLRYHWMARAEELLAGHDYVFYCDVDAEFVDVVDSESVLEDFVVVRHAGYSPPGAQPWPHESRPESAAYVAPEDRVQYFAGGFQGGLSGVYLDACRAMDRQVMQDEQRGIQAVWHDESHLNRYVLDHPPTRILPASFGCDEIDRLPGARVVWLRKDHDAMRRP